MSELICVPSAIPAAERLKHFALARKLFCQRALERRELPDGYVVRFSQDDYAAIARFIANERLCCPFLEFELSVKADAGPLWLQITGPEGTREMLDAELSLMDTCRCGDPSSTTERAAKWTALAGVLGSVAVCTACCLLPYALISMGVAGAWVSGLQLFARYKWLFVVVTASFLGYGFYATYWQRYRESGASDAGTARRSERAIRLWLWIATFLAICGIAFEQIEPLLRK